MLYRKVPKRYQLTSLLLVAIATASVSSMMSCAPVPTLDEVATDRVTATLQFDSACKHFTDAASLGSDHLGDLFVVDRGASALIEYDLRFDSIRSVIGLGRDHFQFDHPTDVDARQANNVFVADFGNHRIEQYSRELAYLATLHTRESPVADERFGYPTAVALDDAGNLYIIDGENRRVIRANNQLQIDRIVGAYTNAVSPDGVLHDPVALAVDAFNDLIVLDHGGDRIVTFDNLGNVLAHRQLPNALQKIRTFGDTLVAIQKPDSSNAMSAVMLFNSRTLGLRGRWEVASTEPREHGAKLPGVGQRWLDVDIRGRRLVVLTSHTLLNFEIMQSK